MDLNPDLSETEIVQIMWELDQALCCLCLLFGIVEDEFEWRDIQLLR